MSDKNLTPLRAQYLSIKKHYPEAIVFFRLGDFYETFDGDAEITARELEIVLTGREMGKGVKVPMAGIPYHAVDNYLARLIGRGHKVAICEQTTRPGGDGKGLMEREVVRLITPGTVVEPGLLDGKRNNYLAAVAPGAEEAGIAFIDITTGEFAAAQLPLSRLEAELERLRPAEIILPRDSGYQPRFKAPVTAIDERDFEPESAAGTLKDNFGVTTLEGYGVARLPLATAAAGAIIAYLKETHKGAVAGISHLTTYSVGDYMALDESTVANLEIFQNATTRAVAGSVLGVLDVTRTPMGARLLRRWLGQPLLSTAAISERQDAVDWLFRNSLVRSEIERWLKSFADLERLANRVRSFTALPREIIALKRSLEAVPELGRALNDASVAGLKSDLKDRADIVALIENAIEYDPATAVGEGGVIRAGFSAELDQLRDMATGAKSYIAKLEAEERATTGIKNLKVGYNQVFGYYLEVSAANLGQVPERFIRKQTLANAERYITLELKEYESAILSSRERLAEMETGLYRRVLGQIAESAEALLAIADAVARLDTLTAFASVAADNNYVKPLIDDSADLLVTAGRHPVVEDSLSLGRFIANDNTLSKDEGRIVILTGPNMAGKSTYLKQTALIVLMAQIGAFVPATAARIGLCDRIFTRIGAHEDLATGKSTFMVEMVETANILVNATSKSLLILDEIGRGTSTYDGLAIARAVVEYIHDHLGARTLFATHYHEMVAMAETLSGVRNCNVAVSEDKGEVVFLHRILPGGVDKSYGIHVAKLAGLPKPVIKRASEVLLELESTRDRSITTGGRRSAPAPQLSLFQPPPSPVTGELLKLDIDAMTPREALEKLYDLKRRAGE
ncbi:DNA mismatch repair protein MutS [Dehalogenimonas sp. THU2]|uniref:DNA mismatch repair protein MutS n=1 Tax=Dehalogenimonas sp. THU2 TaxID=3151121 RepID=UPI0032182DB5